MNCVCSARDIGVLVLLDYVCFMQFRIIKVTKIMELT